MINCLAFKVINEIWIEQGLSEKYAHGINDLR